MPLMCCVPQCTTVYKKGGISFHFFPKEEALRKVWLNVLGMEPVRGTWQRICAKHFNKSDFVYGGNVRKLSKLAVPKPPEHSDVPCKNVADACKTVGEAHAKVVIPQKTKSMSWKNELNDAQEGSTAPFAINVSKMPSVGKVLKKRKQQINAKTLKTIAPLVMSWDSEKKKSESNLTDVLPSTSTAPENHHEAENRTACHCASYVKTIKTLEEEVKYLQKENQRLKEASCPKALFTVQNFAQSDHKMSYYTGFETFKIFLVALQFILPSGNSKDINIHNTEKIGLTEHISKLSVQDQFFLTLMRLRRGMCMETLADLFAVSKTTVNNIFLAWVNLMYLRLGCLDIWPNRDILINRGSDKLKEKFSNVIGSIDCTEFVIERPSSLHKQSQCYSYYKGATTLKSLIMTDPAGAIIYMSPLYTGSISDKAIIESSGFIDILKGKVDKGQILPGDVILADKGFNVTDLFNSLNLELNIPVFRMSGIQFTAEEVVKTRTIAQERIHVERAIRRLKCYKILSLSKIPISCLGSFQQIYVVCCLLTNFRSSLIK